MFKQLLHYKIAHFIFSYLTNMKRFGSWDQMGGMWDLKIIILYCTVKVKEN